jgi:SAM-dependent methyltransferase
MGVWNDEHQQFIQTRRHRFHIYPWLYDFHAFGQYSHSKILEIGCGQGLDLCEHAMHSGDGFFGIGADLSFKSLCLAKRRAEYFHVSDKIDFIVINALNLPFKGEFFDLTYAYGSLHHSPGTIDSLKNACETVRQEGDFKFMVYAVGSLNHMFHITLRGLERIINISGLLKHLPAGKGIGSMTSFKNTGRSAIIHAPYANHYFGITMKRIFENFFEDAEIQRRTILPIAKLSLALQKIPLYSAAERVLGYLLHCAFFNKVR